MTQREFKAALAINKFVNYMGRYHSPETRRQREDTLHTLLFEFAEATKEAHQQNIPMMSPATDVL